MIGDYFCTYAEVNERMLCQVLPMRKEVSGDNIEQ